MHAHSGIYSGEVNSFGWGYATVSLRTKKIKGLHENDFIMAVKLDRLAGKNAIADKQVER
jgi:4a-hydroxytetrahydrobiopterin dehydratase